MSDYEFSEQTKARIRTLMDAEVCLTCDCARDDHFDPGWYDPRTRMAYEDGHLNHCGDCAACLPGCCSLPCCSWRSPGV